MQPGDEAGYYHVGLACDLMENTVSSSTKSRFAASLDAFRLGQHGSFGASSVGGTSASGSPSSVSGSSGIVESGESGNKSRPGTAASGRRSSLLHQSFQQDDEGDADMTAEQASEQDPHPRLQPPLQLAPRRVGLRGMSPSPSSPRALVSSLQDLTSGQDKSFNPLNPSNSKPSHSAAPPASTVRHPTPPPSFTTPMFTSSSTPFSLNSPTARPSPSRAHTSPVHLPRPPPADTSPSASIDADNRNRAVTPEAMSLDDSSILPQGQSTVDQFQSSFDALGMSLPADSADVLPSPISRGPARRPVQRRGSLMVSCG